MPDRDRLDALARHLLEDGHVDNEADARLAAVEIILAYESLSGQPPRGDDDDHGGGCWVRTNVG